MKYELADAHPAFRPLIKRTIDDLFEQYPRCPLRAVRIYARKPGDRSMGNTTENGVISLNPYWFARDPAILEEAGRKQPIVRVGRVELLWHIPAQEPIHVLVHEFGHVLGPTLDGYQEWCLSWWRRATANPENAPTGYALANPTEYFAEAFALTELGYSGKSWQESLLEMLSK